MPLSRKSKYLLLGLFVTAAVAVTIQAIWRPFGARGVDRVRVVDLDLTHPDALIDSTSLSRLPKDILQVPMLKDVLTEDFVYYYEQNESRLSLSGTVRRIAFEHNLSLGDELLTKVMNEPGELALWRDDSGKLRYWLLRVKRNGMARLLQGAANVALSDSQLRKAGELSLGGDDATLYALEYGHEKTMLFASHGDELVVLSDAGMLLEAADPAAVEQAVASGQPVPEGTLLKDRREIIEGLFSDDSDKQDRFRKLFQLSPVKSGHQMVVDADFLSFGYQQFFPGVNALKFEFDGSGWRSAALLDGERLPEAGWKSSRMWQAAPHGAALCTSLPVDWASTAPLLKDMAEDGAAAEVLAAQLEGPAGVCWYAKSRIASPLFITRMKSAAIAQQQAAQLGTLFTALIGAQEPARKDRFPVATRKQDGATLWQRPVSARYGSHKVAADQAEEFSSDRYFPVTLAVAGEYVLFSPDERLVTDALDVLAKRYPSAADGAEQPDQLAMIVTPAGLAPLFQHEAFDALPDEQEPVLRAAAQQHLIPRLKALAKYPPLRVSLAGSVPRGLAWVDLQWQAQAR